MNLYQKYASIGTLITQIRQLVQEMNKFETLSGLLKIKWKVRFLLFVSKCKKRLGLMLGIYSSLKI